MNKLHTASFALTIIGITVLTLGFILQTHKMYKHKDAKGLSLVSWVQNFLGRLLFSLYMALTDANTALPVIIAQVAMSLLSVPIIYYAIRNRKTEGTYVKEHFKHRLFAGKIMLFILTLGVFALALLMSKEINVIHVRHVNEILIIVLSTISAILVSFSFMPQTIRTIKSRDTKSISLGMVSLFTFGNIVFIIGFVIQAIAGNYSLVIVPIITMTIGAIGMGTIALIKYQNMRKLHEKEESDEDIEVIL